MKKLISKAALHGRVRALARRLDRDYRNRRPVLVGILKGAFVFLADLARQMTVPLEIDFLSINSYNGRRSSGIVRMTGDLSRSIEGRDVIVIEDIIDTGRTISYILDNLKTRRPRSLSVCTLLNKKADRIVDVPVRYVGFEIPPVFVVGYGLDQNDQYRNLDYIGVIDAE